MAMQIAWKVTASVARGSSFSSAQSVEPEACDEIDVTLADQDADVEVEVQPGAAAQVQFLLMSATSYGADLTYKVGAAGNPPHALDRPLLLAGSGAVGLLGSAPKKLLFTNKLGSEVAVHVLIGRDATP